MAYLGRQPVIGNFVKLDAITAVNGQAAYTMQNGGSNFTDYESVNQFLVSLNGTIQAPTDSFTVSGSTLTFASNLSTGDVIDFVMVFGNSLSAGTPTDATVSTAKIINGAVTNDKIASSIINSQTAETSIADADEVLIYDSSASALRKITKANFVSGVGGTNTPLVAVRASTGPNISSGTNTKIPLDTEMIDTDNTFDSSTNYRWSPGVAGKYYMTGTVSLNINVAGKYIQSLIYKNGSLASYSQAVAEGNNATYTVTVDLIDDNDGDDYYELYIRQNTGGNIGLNHSATGLYTRFFGFKLLT